MICPFVTGANGFIGRHLVATLTAQGFPCRTHDSRDGDIAEATLDLSGCTHVIHLAGKAFVPDSWTTPGDFYRVNVQGTANVLEQCRRHQLPVTLISSYVYGQPRQLPIPEDHPLDPLNPYAHSKILAEELAASYRRFFGLVVTVVRPFNVYGPGQNSRYLIPLLIRQALDKGTHFFDVADARPRRDYLFVTDLVSLLCKTIHAAKPVTVNAGSGASFSAQDIVEILNQEAPAPKTLRSREERRPSEVIDVVADISRARSEFGWEPTVSFRDGLRRTLQFYASLL